MDKCEDLCTDARGVRHTYSCYYGTEWQEEPHEEHDWFSAVYNSYMHCCGSNPSDDGSSGNKGVDMNSQPEGHPTDSEILTAERLGMDPWEVKRIMDAWEQAFDDLEQAREGRT